MGMKSPRMSPYCYCLRSSYFHQHPILLLLWKMRQRWELTQWYTLMCLVSTITHLLRIFIFHHKKDLKCFAYLNWINTVLWRCHTILTDVNNFKTISKRMEVKHCFIRHFFIFIAMHSINIVTFSLNNYS